MNDDVLKTQPEPAANRELVWAFDLGKGAIGDAPAPFRGKVAAASGKTYPGNVFPTCLSVAALRRVCDTTALRCNRFMERKQNPMNTEWTLPNSPRPLPAFQPTGFTMSHLECASSDDHAQLTGDPNRTPWQNCGLSFPCSSRGDEALTYFHFPPSAFGLSLLTSAATRVAQASPPAGCGSVPLPVRHGARTRGGTPREPAAGTATLRSNDLQPDSQTALLGAIKKCHQTLWAGGKLLALLPKLLSGESRVKEAYA